MKSKKIIIGSRGSKLALIYAKKAREKILEVSKEFNIENVEIKKITTAGDLNQKDRLSEIGGKGLFSSKIEKELLENKIHIAIHALKDMPSDETDGLLTNCFLKRNDPREVLISKNKVKFEDLLVDGTKKATVTSDGRLVSRNEAKKNGDNGIDLIKQREWG